MKLVPLPERPEPDRGADDEDDDGVDDEDPVEADEADGDVVALDDGEDGEEPGYEEADAEDEAACDLRVIHSFIHSPIHSPVHIRAVQYRIVHDTRECGSRKHEEVTSCEMEKST